MNETEINSPAPGSDLESQVEALQRQVFLLLLSLVVVSATVVFYLFCEAHFMGNDLAEIQPQAAAMIKQYKVDQAAIENLKSQLIEYGKTHPAFQQQVLMKDGLVQPAR